MAVCSALLGVVCCLLLVVSGVRSQEKFYYGGVPAVLKILSMEEMPARLDF